VPDNLSFRMMQLNRLQRNGHVKDYAIAAERALQRFGNSPVAMNNIAWAIAAEQTATDRNLDLAMTAAVLANEYTGHLRGYMLDTLARVHYEQGNVQEATLWQRLATAKTRTRGTLEALELYVRELTVTKPQ